MKTPEEIKRDLMTCLVLGRMPREHHEAMRFALLYIHQLEAERDAAVEDMTSIVQEFGEPFCGYCGADRETECTGHCWTHNEGFKWRGVQKEDSDAVSS